MTPLCVIPARRGSKRLPEKNIAELGGRPMLAYTVDAALESELFDRVLVSTEDEWIAELAAELGATPHRRPGELAGDLVSATDVCLEALEDEDAVVCLQPSSPLRTAGDVRSAWHQFLAADADFLVSVTAIDPHYFHWALEPDGGAWHRMVFGKEYLVERPLLPTRYRPNGAIKIGLAGPLRERRDFFGPRLAVYEMPEERSVHVALPFDLQVAELALR
jgi:CMP-N,N'-diacetyllegionaminic acid synthase